jgi:hypothetical protein
VLVGYLSIERTCGDPYRLIGAAMSKPLAAWGVSLLYLSAHAWLIAVYLQTAARANTLWPSLQEVRTIWGGGRLKIGLMLAVLLVEYAPQFFWRAMGSGFPGLCRLS